MMEFRHQRELFDPNAFTWPVHCIGLGGIGSAITPALAKLGVQRFVLWDPDMVEPENVPSQFAYRPADIGRKKVEVIAELVRSYGVADVVTHDRKATAEDRFEGVVVSGVDSMASRSSIWKAIRYQQFVPLYLDGRIGGEFLELHVVRPCVRKDIERYESFLFTDEEAAPLLCGQRAIIHPALILAGLVDSTITRWLRKEAMPGRMTFNCKTTACVVDSMLPGHSTRGG